MAKSSNKFGERVRFIREMRGMTQAQLGTASGMDSTQIAHIEAGDRLPGVERLTAICRGLVVSADYLLGLSERVQP